MKLSLIPAALALMLVPSINEADEPEFSTPEIDYPRWGGSRGKTQRAVPDEIIRPRWLRSRAREQKRQVNETAVFADFSFSDELHDSGIRFRNRVVDDAAITYKPLHYDHGNGVAVADVDGDGRLDIYFLNQVGSNGLWRNIGNGRFVDITGTAGVAVEDRISVTASFADIDNDGDPDLFVTTVRDGNLLFRNDGNGSFTDISSTAGVDHRGHSSGAVFFDYDNDGLLDLFVSNVGQYTSTQVRTMRNGKETFYDGFADAFTGHLKPERFESSLLYHNEGNARFRDVTDAMGMSDNSWTGDAGFLDANGDGWLDLYVLDMQGNDEYFENEAGKRFVRKSRELFPRTPWGAMGLKVFDYNGDGLLDIYITDMHSDMGKNIGPEQEKLKAEVANPNPKESIYGNALFQKQPDGSYTEVSDSVGAENYWPWGLSVGDLNADGFEDVFITSSMNFPFRYGVNSLLLNDAGRRFVDAEFAVGVEPRQGNRTAQPWFTLECGGQDRSSGNCGGQSGDVQVWGALGSRSSVIFDADDDGDLDIITNEFNDYPMVLVSDLSERRKNLRYLKVDLEGTTSNRDGLGAVVRIQTSERSYVRVMDGQSGYLSHSVQPLYFGFAGGETITGISVDWPSGIHQKVTDYEVNRVLAIRESRQD